MLPRKPARLPRKRVPLPDLPRRSEKPKTREEEWADVEDDTIHPLSEEGIMAVVRRDQGIHVESLARRVGAKPQDLDPYLKALEKRRCLRYRKDEKGLHVFLRENVVVDTGDPIPQKRTLEDPNARAIAQALLREPGQTVRELAAKLGMPENRVHRNARLLLARRLVTGGVEPGQKLRPEPHLQEVLDET